MADIVFVSFTGGAEKRTNVHAEAGINILDAARLGGVLIETPCDGAGTCGKCGVTIASSNECVLACSTKIRDGAVYIAPDYEAKNKSLRILSERLSLECEKEPFITKRYQDGKTNVYGGGRLLGSEAGDSTAFLYGLAVDIGTTTIVTELVNILSGETIASESALNPQTRYAQDVLGRIHFAGKEDGLETLYRDFVTVLNGMIRGLAARAGINSEYIYELVYSGNTTMLHLACDTDPSSLGRYPYTPKITGGLHVTDKNIAASPYALIYLPPVISAWVGADISSGILAAGLERESGVSLFVDIGTNGEMALAKDGRLAASSTAAGPAFEGMNISCGMRASAGAVEAFSIDENGSCSFHLIGGAAKAEGICGSGLLDIAGELVRTGLIDKRGRFVPPEDGAYPKLAGRMRPVDGKSAFFITDNVYVAQKDVRQIQLAKSAVRCGIELLLARFGNSARDVDRVIIAGSFGYHLNEKSLTGIGLLPEQFAGKVSFAGNTSLAGAAALLINAPLRDRVKEIAAGVEKIELAQDSSFERAFINYMSF
ncbi:MAG: ASKHA domain-containing protein [Spirochaetaceae bacterium]|nr:ASKHA domain-containing protein [Spirochaetaceae bacterium]